MWKYNVAEIDSPKIGTAGASGSGGIDLATGAGGIRPNGGVFHTGNSAAIQAADGVNSTPVITEIYLAEVFVPFTCRVNGIYVFNGSVVATDKLRVLLYTEGGAIVASSAAAGFQPTAADTYEHVAFALGSDGTTATTAVIIPTGTYFIGCIYNGTTNRFNAHGVGAFRGGKDTGAVFATAGVSAKLTATMPTTFTAANLPPIASLGYV